MASRKHLFNVAAILKGLSITFGFMFRRRPTIQYPSRKKQHAPRFHGLARAAPLRRRQGALHRLRALLERLPRQRDYGDRRGKLAGRIAGRRASATPRATRSTSCAASFAACAKKRVRPTRSC